MPIPTFLVLLSLLSTDLVINTSHGSWCLPSSPCLPLSPASVLCLLLLSSLQESQCQASILHSCSLFYFPVSSRNLGQQLLFSISQSYFNQAASAMYICNAVSHTRNENLITSSKSESHVYTPYLNSNHSTFITSLFWPCYLLCHKGLSLLLLAL